MAERLVISETEVVVADAPTADISPADQRALVEALRKELADVASFETEVGPPIGNVAGAVMDVWPDACRRSSFSPCRAV